MEEEKSTPASVDEYIAQFPDEIRSILQAVRETIRKAAAGAEEKISWQMPTYARYGNVAHFAAQKNHLGFYPGAEGIAAFAEELKPFKTSKGAAQFPYSKPIPHDLIARIVRYRLHENETAASARQNARKNQA